MTSVDSVLMAEAAALALAATVNDRLNFNNKASYRIANSWSNSLTLQTILIPQIGRLNSSPSCLSTTHKTGDQISTRLAEPLIERLIL
jgi:hypothetical protein